MNTENRNKTFEEHDFRSAPEDLLVELGTALYILEGGLSARPPRNQELVKRALTWLNENRAKIANIIHNDPKLKSLAYEQRDKQILISALTDALTAAYTGLPAATIATLVVHYALDHVLYADKD